MLDIPVTHNPNSWLSHLSSLVLSAKDSCLTLDDKVELDKLMWALPSPSELRYCLKKQKSMEFCNWALKTIAETWLKYDPSFLMENIVPLCSDFLLE
jgi:hypothetical protein